MKKLFLPALAAVAFILAPADKAAAQMVVNDPIHMGVHISQFAKQLKEWSETVQNYQVVTDARDIASVTKQITGEVRDMTAQGLALQQQVQADLRKVQTIQDLYISNPQELFVRALAQAGRTQNNNYMPVYHKAERLRQALQLTNPQQDLNTIFDVFSRFGAGTSVGSDRISSADYQAKKDEAVVSTFAYESMQRKRKIDTAMSYYKIADEMTKQSVELNATLKNPGRYSMTEGERMAALNTSNDNMVKAMQLRLEADRLIGETSQPSPMQGAAENAYADVMLQQELIKMDVYRNHN
jgi:hypothetical protein